MQENTFNQFRDVYDLVISLYEDPDAQAYPEYTRGGIFGKWYPPAVVLSLKPRIPFVREIKAMRFDDISPVSPDGHLEISGPVLDEEQIELNSYGFAVVDDHKGALVTIVDGDDGSIKPYLDLEKVFNSIMAKSFELGFKITDKMLRLAFYEAIDNGTFLLTTV